MDGVIPATSISGDKGKAVCGVLTKRGRGNVTCSLACSEYFEGLSAECLGDIVSK